MGCSEDEEDNGGDLEMGDADAGKRGMGEEDLEERKQTLYAYYPTSVPYAFQVSRCLIVFK